MTLATNDEEIVDAEVVEDFDVDDVFKPRPVHEVEVYVEDSLERAVRLTREAWARKDAAAVEVGAGIACMVKRSRPGRPAIDSQESIKLTGLAASERLGKSRDTIRAYLDTWDRLAANGLCAPSTELTPDDLDSLVLPSTDDWQNEQSSILAGASAPTRRTLTGRSFPNPTTTPNQHPKRRCNGSRKHDNDSSTRDSSRDHAHKKKTTQPQNGSSNHSPGKHHHAHAHQKHQKQNSKHY